MQNFNELPAMFDSEPMLMPSEAARMTDSEAQREISRRVRAEAPNVQGNDIGPYFQSGMAYFGKHGNLEGWTVHIRSVGAEFARIDKEAAARRIAVLKAAGFKPRYATKAEVHHVMKTAHDACMADGTKPSASAMLRDAGVPAKTANKLASRGSLHTAKAWAELGNHPARQAMQEQGVLSKRKQRAATGGSLAGTVAALYSLADHTKDRQRLGAVESEVAELKARLAALETRQDITEAGEHWHAVALRMRSAGPTAIAAATGQQVNTVKQYLKRHR